MPTEEIPKKPIMMTVNLLIFRHSRYSPIVHLVTVTDEM